MAVLACAVMCVAPMMPMLAQTPADSAPRPFVTLGGRLALHTFTNVRRVNNVDNPQFVLADPPPGTAMRGLGMSMRQSRLRLQFGGVESGLGSEIFGDAEVDFYGGQLPSAGGRHFPVLRLRTARAFMRWQRAEVMLGQESPLISPVNPETPAAIGTPAFATAGNLWLWIPQLRLGAFTPGPLRFRADVAALAPTSGDPAAAFDTDFDIAERSMRPYLQARVSVAAIDDDAVLRRELGCGVHQGWLAPAGDPVSSFALACDVRMDFTSAMELRGEYFTGQGVRGLGGGGIGQNLDVNDNPMRTTGGWAQFNVRAAGVYRAGVGCGADHPLYAVVRKRNDACAVHASLSPATGLFVGGELRRIRTEYAAGRFTNDHVTLALGFGF